MIRGKTAIPSQLWRLLHTRRAAFHRVCFLPVQRRQLSSHPDLFTLDIDLDDHDNDHTDSRRQKGRKSRANAEKSFKSPSNTTFDTSKGHKSKTNVDQVEDPSIIKNDHESLSSDREMLDDILSNIIFDTEEAQSRSDADINSMFGDLLSQTPAKPTQTELIESDLGIDGMQQLKTSGRKTQKRPEENVIADEKELFEKIFATYSQTEEKTDSSESLHKQVLLNLQESFTSVNKAPEVPSILQAIQSLSEKESNTIEANTREALARTLEYIKHIPTRESVVAFAGDIFERFQSTEFHRKEFFLHKIKGESSKDYLERQEHLCNETRSVSEEKPEKPVINAFTMPIIFNHIVSILCKHHHDGALALTLFNLVKEDLNLYTNVCNQQTYNEMLKVHWVSFGKRSLCEIELVYVEMINNGFSGDAHTFAILKEILSTYYAMKLGLSSFNPGGMPIWSKEDDKRAKNLTEKLKSLGKRLKRQQLFGTSSIP